MLGCMPSHGSSNISSRGLIINARAIASCCCCQPDKSPPRRWRICASTGNISLTSRGMCFFSVRPAAKAVLRFSSTVSRGKISRPCGTYPIPKRARASARLPSKVSPSNSTAPERNGSKPITALSKDVFPTPIRPISTVQPPAGTVRSRSHRVWLSPGNWLRPLISSISRAQIDFDDPRISLHLVHAALHEHATLVQDRHFACDGTHEAHVVLHHYHRMSPGEPDQQLRRALGLLMRHAGDGFVHQQRLGLLHEQHADLQPLLLAVRQFGGARMTLRSEHDRVQYRIDTVALLARHAREQRGPHALVGAHRELEVFRHAVFGKYRGFLKFTADARARDLVLAHACQIHLGAEKGRALIGTRLSGNHVHHRGLARTVGADDAAQFAVVDIKRELIKRLEAVKAHRDVLKIQYGCAARVHRARSTAGSYVGYFVKSFFTPFEQRPHLATSLSAGRRRRRHRPTKPRGRNNVATMNRAPSANNHTSGNAPVK